MRSPFNSLNPLLLSITLLALVPFTSCGEAPTEPVRSLGGELGIAEANPESNGQVFMALPPFGLGIVSFPQACFVFEPGFEPDPHSWERSTMEAVVTKEHALVQDGILLAGSFFTGLLEGSGHGVLNGHFRRDGTFIGATLKINGTLNNGAKVNCKLNIDRNGNPVQSFVRIGTP